MQIVHPVLQVHGEEQSRQAQIVIAVQVTYKNMIDPVVGKLKSHELHLSPFTAVDEKVAILDLHPMRGRKTPVGGEGGAGAEDNDFKLWLGFDSGYWLLVAGFWLQFRLVAAGASLLPESWNLEPNLELETCNLLFVLHILLNLMHKHCIDSFFDGRENVQNTVELRDPDQF